MERASKLIRGLMLPGGTLSNEELACAAWAEAVGKRIAAHSRAARMVRNRLIVEVEDHIWQHQLFALQRQILGNIAKVAGNGVVEDLEFRVLPRRRPPQVAPEAVPGAPVDEAEGIEDRLMRGIYRAARKRALA